MVAASDTAPQHAPRPLPLFLDLVRRVAVDDPVLAARALAGVRRYAAAQREPDSAPLTRIALGPLKARVAGESGPLVVLVPSLINPADVMDLDRDRSLLRWLGANGHRALLLDWGTPTPADANRDLAAHVTEHLLPALTALGEPVHLVGYCLSGVLAMAAAPLASVHSLSLIATPWHFDAYPATSRATLAAMWKAQRSAAETLGLLPLELLQTAFWSLDPERTVHKFAALADLDDDDPVLIRFARLEDWANGGAALAAAAGRDLFKRLLQDDETGRGLWTVGGECIDPSALGCRAHQFTAAADQIAPAETACRVIPSTACPSGHVGMMVGSQAMRGCWEPLADWIKRG